MSHKKVVRIDPLTCALPLAGVDSHAHLDDKRFTDDLEQVLERAKAVGIKYIMNIFCDPLKFAEHKQLFEQAPQVFFILGIHPQSKELATEEALEILRLGLESDSRIRGLGEIGLDYYWKDCPPDLQKQILRKQLAMAKKMEQPVIIHCREAEADCLDLLESEGMKDYPLLWHCFGGDKDLAARIIGNGWHISIPGPVTYKANSHLREAVETIPLERLMLETDCPYLSPEPWRGTRNESAYTVFTAQTVAKAKQMPTEELWTICGQNAIKFFRLEN